MRSRSLFTRKQLRYFGLASSAVLLWISLWAPADSWGQETAAMERTPGAIGSAPRRHEPPELLIEPNASNAKAKANGSPSELEPVDGPRVWRLIQGRSWRIEGPPGEPPEVTDESEKNRGACSSGMVEIAGKMKQAFLVDELQLQACTSWIDRKWPERCAVYDREKWLSLSKEMATKDMHFCMDRFEYPNRKGEYPIILVSFFEARDSCEAIGKRLCTEDEWTFACEGEEATPYPNGYVRDPEACLNDRPWRQFHEDALVPRSGERAKEELDRLWQGLPSGARPLCRSAFGVYDLTGNIDEWTRSSVPGERPSVLKGGYWGPVRTRCRPATKAHDEQHTFYQQGFRCCADVPPSRPSESHEQGASGVLSEKL